MRTPIDNFFDLQSAREIAQRTGLEFQGRGKLGRWQEWYWYACRDCGTTYPDMGHGPQANGHILKRCLCKEDN